MSIDAAQAQPVGVLLRQWRQRRGLSQLALADQANVSTRHVSFVETGRANPTAAMIIKLSACLDVPLRERNHLLLAGGYAPAYVQHDLDAPELSSIRVILSQVLAAHSPHPALFIDRYWNLLEANDAVGRLLEGCAPSLLEPPINLCRLSLDPAGLASRIINLDQWRAHLIGQVVRRARRTADSKLDDLVDELMEYPGGLADPQPHGTVVLPLQLEQSGELLSFFSMTAVLETAEDPTLADVSIETFLPADASTARWISTQTSPLALD